MIKADLRKRMPPHGQEKVDEKIGVYRNVEAERARNNALKIQLYLQGSISTYILPHCIRISILKMKNFNLIAIYLILNASNY